MTDKEKNGMTLFILLWVGQMASMLGSMMTSFALMFWAYSITGRATALALVGFCSLVPQVLLSPVAGALVDRWDRKSVMMLADLGAALSTISILALFASGNLQIWHFYVVGAFAGVFGAFQFPAYSAATTLLVPKEHYARASGMVAMAQASMGIVAPMLAGFLLMAFGPVEKGILFIMGIDLITFTLGISILMMIPIPRPAVSAEGAASKGSLVKESLFGFKYILARPAFLGLLFTFLLTNMISNMAFVVVTPMILERTAGNAQLLGVVMSVMGVGGVAGGLLLSVWGGPKRKVLGVLGGIFVSNLTGVVMLGFGNASLGVAMVVWCAAAFLLSFVQPIIGGSSQAIWQSKVPPDIQGKVFSARLMLAWGVMPLGTLMGGPLADNVFEPGMKGSFLPAVFGWYTGTSAGAGMGAMFVLAGLLGAAVPVIAYSIPKVRNMEDAIPDHDAAGKAAAAPAEGAPAAQPEAPRTESPASN